MTNMLSGRWTKVCPRCGVTNGWTVTYCVECGQSLRTTDLDKAVPYDESIRKTFQEVHRKNLQRTLRMWTYLMAGVIVLILLSLIFAPLSTSTINIAVSTSSLTQSEHYEILIDGGFVGQGDIAAGTIVIWTIPYHFAWAFSGKHDITVEATIGDGSGGHAASRTFTVFDGGTYTVTLNL
jgi:hypothetical protein